MDEHLEIWDDELTVESIVSRLLHLSPTEENFKQGCAQIERLIADAVEIMNKSIDN